MVLFGKERPLSKEKDLKLAKKSSKKVSSSISIKGVKGGKSLLEKISTIVSMVEMNLGKYRDDYEVIREEELLHDYITEMIGNGVCAIDTETAGPGDPVPNPLFCTIAGICLYTPRQKGVYIPLNHVSYITNAKVEGQISHEFVVYQLKRLMEKKPEIMMANSKYDIRVIKNTLDLEVYCNWDCLIAARLLDENSHENNLKALHKKYCMNGEGSSFAFTELFNDVPFTYIPINTGYLYAAKDAEMTYELYKFQEPYLGFKDTSLTLSGVRNVFHNIEMPLIKIIAEMEDTGIAFDFEKQIELSKVYHEKLNEKLQKVYEVINRYQDDIKNYRLLNPGNKLDEPINIGSPTQLAILLYDILNIQVVDKEKPRGTGEPILQKIDHPLSKVILEYREVEKLLNTYIDKMVNVVNPKTKRIHCSFNQLGTVTGRFSSSEPNLQNIPAKNKEIRKMFKASEGYVLFSGDYSQQEPRLLAHMSNDKKMIQAYKDGRDIYSEVASITYNLPYEECKEFYPDGTKNEKGAKLRYNMKQLVLSIMYDKGINTVAEDLKTTKKKAQEVMDKVFNAFPNLKQFREESREMARTLGYVTTNWGRKRRLPDMQLEPYEFSYLEGQKNPNFDPLSFDVIADNVVPWNVQKKYIQRLEREYHHLARRDIIEEAKKQGILIKNNGGFIAEATRQCVNSRIQGSAADQIKLAMILIGNDKQLKQWGVRLLLQVHDELLSECPIVNMKKCIERFQYLMIEAGKDLKVPSKVDIFASDKWFGEEMNY